MKKNKYIQCRRCGTRQRHRQVYGKGWNAEFVDGRVVGHTCPECQTVDEIVDAAHSGIVHELRIGDDGRLMRRLNADGQRENLLLMAGMIREKAREEGSSLGDKELTEIAAQLPRLLAEKGIQVPDDLFPGVESWKDDE